jgi:hypothetical protein
VQRETTADWHREAAENKLDEEERFMAASVESGRARPSTLNTVLNTLLPLLLLVLTGAGLLSLGQRRFAAWQEQLATDFTFHMELWVQWVGLVALSGLAFGLAAWFPRTPFSYRWGRVALVGILPLAMLVHFVLLWGYALPRDWSLPDLLERQSFYFAVGPQFVLAALIGVSVASGFAPSRHPGRSDTNATTELDR